MKGTSILLICLAFSLGTACSENQDRFEVEIPDFDFPRTVDFEPELKVYEIFEGTPGELIPSADFHLLELSSILFTDYAKKQRLVKVPTGTQIKKMADGSIDFPNGTILVKTFFYYHDERNPELGKTVIESRLIIKENDTWNVATYVWNEAQTAANLTMSGLDTQVSWTDASGIDLSTAYHVPDENECIACHQTNSTLVPLGSNLRNLNRMVDRGGERINQISHLQAVGIMNSFQPNALPQIVDYNDMDASLAERGRAYLAMNCAHCHNPDGWDESAERDFDFRYETPLSQSGIPFGEDKIINAVSNSEMPFIGTTLLDQEGVGLIIEFIESL